MFQKRRLLIRLVCLLAVLGMALTQGVAGAQPNPAYSEMYTFPVHDENGMEVEPSRWVEGAEASLLRTNGGIRMSVNAAQLTPGHVVTAWRVIFNDPGRCSGGVCDEPDVLPPPGHVLADVSLLYADGAHVGPDGTAFFLDFLRAGDTSDAVFGPGLLDIQGAEVHVVLRTHGPLQPDAAQAQQSSLNGGCDPDPPHAPCQDVQFAIFKQDRSGTFYGERAEVAEGTAQTWIKLDAAGNPASIGVSISEAAFMSVGGDVPQIWSLDFPAEASGTPYTHMGLDWNPQGHEPPGIYDIPHFDFHFYMISKEMRVAIGPDDPEFEIVPAPQFLPADHVKIPGGVPQMGAHWIDPMSGEFQGEPFTHTMIYGSYNGKVAFMEPMITWGFINNTPSFSAEIKQPEAFAMEGVFYPTAYSFHFDEETREYRFSLDGFVQR